MVREPDKYIERFAAVEPEVFFIHPETCADLDATIVAIKACNSKVGLVYNPDQDVVLDAELLQKIDYILVMSVHPGFAGQKFLHDQVSKISFFSSTIVIVKSKFFLKQLRAFFDNFIKSLFFKLSNFFNIYENCLV